MLHGLSNHYASKGIANKIDSIIGIVWVYDMLLYLGC